MWKRLVPVLLLLTATACAGADPAPAPPATTSGTGEAAEFDLSGIGFEVHQEPG